MKKNLVAVVAAVSGFLCIVSVMLLVLGYKPFILSTQSMDPLYPKGSLCWVNTKADLEKLEVGDVLVYRSPAKSLVLHRLIKLIEKKAEDSTTEDSTNSINNTNNMRGTRGTLSVIMQGDTSDFKQEIELSKINFIGTEAFTIPYISSIFARFHTAIWILSGVFLVLACMPVREAKE